MLASVSASQVVSEMAFAATTVLGLRLIMRLTSTSSTWA